MSGRFSRSRIICLAAVAGGVLVLAAVSTHLPGPGARVAAIGVPGVPARRPSPQPTPAPAVLRRQLVVSGLGSGEDPNTGAAVSPAAHTGALEPLRLQLAAAIDAYAVPGNYAVAVTDLRTGETVSINGIRPQISGCILNVFVLLSTMYDVQLGLRELSEIDALVTETLLVSDAGTARELYAIGGDGDVLAGLARVDALLRKLGMNASILDHPPGYPEETRGLDDNNWVTAEDMNRGLALLYGGGLLVEPYRSYLLDAMTHVAPELNYLLGSNADATVSHKNGYLFEDGNGWVDNDAGIVRFIRDGVERAYAITFLAMDVDEVGADVPLGQQLVRLAWEHFSSAYPESATAPKAPSDLPAEGDGGDSPKVVTTSPDDATIQREARPHNPA